jgi:DNA polymerase-3 subunit delta
MDAIEFLTKLARSKPQPVYAITGDEDFLKRQSRDALLKLLLDDADPAFAVSTFAGISADLSTVRGELETLPFLSPRRVVIIEQADPFVTKFRPQLEKLVAAPPRGVLILEVKTWPATTRLAKQLPDAATIVCKAPPAARLPGWCAQRAADAHGKKLSTPAAALLLELVGPSLGMLDQEIAKLAAFVGDRKTIDADDIDTLAGRSRQAEVFKIFDAIGNGQPADALAILNRLFEQGDEPLAILGALSWQLRKLGAVAGLVSRGASLEDAMARAGAQPFPARVASWHRLMSHLGRSRLDRLFDWLLEVDMGLKGASPLAPEAQLQRLVVRLAQPRVPPRSTK